MAATTYNVSTFDQGDSDADFRDWLDDWHDAFITCGLVQTSDTGQIDRETATVPGSAGKAGYEVYRFNDALQATLPIYVKVEYGCNFVSGSDVRLGIWVTIGAGTDGAGTVSQPANDEEAMGVGLAASNPEIHAAGDPSEGWFWVYQHDDSLSVSRGLLLCVQRSRSTSGPTADSYVAWGRAGSGGDWGMLSVGSPASTAGRRYNSSNAVTASLRNETTLTGWTDAGSDPDLVQIAPMWLWKGLSDDGEGVFMGVSDCVAQVVSSYNGSETLIGWCEFLEIDGETWLATNGDLFDASLGAGLYLFKFPGETPDYEGDVEWLPGLFEGDGPAVPTTGQLWPR